MDPVYYLEDTLVFAGIFILLTLSLNIEYGFTRLGNFGKVAFFMVGAYTYALLGRLGFPFYLSLTGSTLVAATIGLIISLPALRLREDYLAIVTLSFGEILRLIIKAQEGIAGGVKEAVRRVRESMPHTLKVEVEAESLAQVEEALAAGADVIMLDNMPLKTMREAVRCGSTGALLQTKSPVRGLKPSRMSSSKPRACPVANKKPRKGIETRK